MRKRAHPNCAPGARNQRPKPNIDQTYFLRPRITRIAPEIKARAPEALPALISGAVVISAMASPDTPIRINIIPKVLSIFPPLNLGFGPRPPLKTGIDQESGQVHFSGDTYQYPGRQPKPPIRRDT
jgi:hypothetical protein